MDGEVSERKQFMHDIRRIEAMKKLTFPLKSPAAAVNSSRMLLKLSDSLLINKSKWFFTSPPKIFCADWKIQWVNIDKNKLNLEIGQ